MTTPAITLTATLQDIFGAAGGSVANPCRLCITLCGYGSELPRIAGTSMLARVGPTYLQSSNGVFSTPIWGNDAITPSGTYYTVEVIDAKGNVVQCDAYQLTGSGTQDLSTLTPAVGPGPNLPSGYITINPATGSISISPFGWSGPITFDLTLTGNVTISAANFIRGQRVQFIIRQNSVGGWAVTWNPSKFINAGAVNAGANSVSTQEFTVDSSGKLYPPVGWQ